MKLSDALRGAADRAPIDQMSVSAAGAASRVKRERALRMGANGLVGASAAAVIAVGAMGPLGASMSSQDAMSAPAMDGGAESYSGADEEMSSSEDSAAEASRPAEQWMCGTEFDPADGTWSWGDDSGVTFSVGQPEVDGEQILLPHSLEASRPVELISSPDYVVTWDGIVVGRMVQPPPIEYGPADEPTLPESGGFERLDPATDFATLEQSTVLEPVNCWDGEPLPAADYEVHQAWTLAYWDDAVVPWSSPSEPGVPSGSPVPAEPSGPVEPSGPAVDPSPSPGTGVAEDSAGEGSDSAESLPAPPTPELFRVAAEPVPLTIDGERVDDPFADYLGGDGPVEPLPSPAPSGGPAPLPDGYLTPDIARQMFEAGVTNAPEGEWDMAAGTQRWVKVGDSASGQDDWARHYFGCSWDAAEGATFPATSAQMSLLDVDVDLPARIDVSYGFVVDGNPLVSSSVTNASDYTIPGYWSAQPQLFLVRDGRVVAEAYPVSTSRDGMSIAMEAEESGMVIAPEYGRGLEPGQSVSDDFLWRDVTGCYTESGQADVRAGEYTVLAMQSVSVSNMQIAFEGSGVEPRIAPSGEPLIAPTPWSLDGGDAALYDSELGGDEPAIAVPEPTATWGGEQMDWIELQGWTSLGTITLSAS
ncbi:hypothetical protein ACNI3K_01195 [Demequina sp. SO4-13]|uniref:hypothetical protein n=1 Tax=Demequina sp. SO4-13 TaxID=3401027 RepID=UPI003AF4A2A6